MAFSPHDNWVLPEKSIPYNNALFSLTIIGSLVNTLLLIRMYKARSSLKVFHMALVNMVISDTFCAYLSLLFYGAHVLNTNVDYYWCYFSSTELISFLGLSISSATIISVERYFQIVLGRTTTYQKMLGVLILFWLIHLAVGSYPVLAKLTIVSQASNVYCLPDFRIPDFPHRKYGIIVVTFLILVLSIITASYYLIWKKAIADGFKWNEKSFVIKNIDYVGDQPPTSDAASPNIKNSEANLISKSSGLNKSNRSLAVPELSFSSEQPPSSDSSARQKQMAMTKNLAIITAALYLAWLGSLCSFLYQMSTGRHVGGILDSFLGIFHFSHCIFNPIIILTMDSRWKIRLNFLKRRASRNVTDLN
ncbi:hypothetical protein BKA69DRAFT_505631 [Paraphysoderma sedebokerense]|nr:hypothetical protein BKA69DRAFT_505631 [Paraphysoderma sedebokerense]